MDKEICEIPECQREARTLVDGLCPRCADLANKIRVKVQAGQLACPNASTLMLDEKGDRKSEPLPRSDAECGVCGELIESEREARSIIGKDSKGYVLHKLCESVLRHEC